MMLVMTIRDNHVPIAKAGMILRVRERFNQLRGGQTSAVSSVDSSRNDFSRDNRRAQRTIHHVAQVKIPADREHHQFQRAQRAENLGVHHGP